jgi:rhodanese-related sulfurtransferase
MDQLRVTPQEVKAALDSGQPPVLLDVRAPDSWAGSDHQIPGAIRLPLADFDAHADELPRDREIVAYCT